MFLIPHRREGEEPGGRRSIIVLLQLFFDLHSCAPRGILYIIDDNCSRMQRPLLDSGGQVIKRAQMGRCHHVALVFTSNKDQKVLMLNMSVA